MSEKTIFENILDGEIQADIVLEGEDFLAFRDINPKAPIHVLVIPRKKIRSIHQINDFSQIQIASFVKNIQKTAEYLGLGQNGYRVVFNTGVDGGQTVDYIHAHILGGRNMTWPPG